MAKRLNRLVFAVALVVMTAVSAMGQWTTSGNNIFNSNSGNVGVGTTTPTNKLHVSASILPQFVLAGTSETRFQIIVGGTPVFLFNHDGSSGAIGTQSFTPFNLQTNSANRLTISAAGLVGIGTQSPTQQLHVVGNAIVTGTLSGGNIQATYQDVAEWVPASHDLEPGTVVVLNSAKENEVFESSKAYDTAVAGVVTAQPGIILGESGVSKEMIATTGRVRVRVDATAAPIRVGDLLVTSERPGFAMRSKPIDVGGAAIHRPGTIIGKALEPLPTGVGSILVLLSLQ
jgi:hypothetical protein